MNSLHKNVHGFGLIAILIIFLVIGVAGFAGYKVYDQQTQSSFSTDSASKKVVEPTVADVPKTVENSGDLADMEAVLNQVDTDADTTDLDADLSTF